MPTTPATEAEPETPAKPATAAAPPPAKFKDFTSPDADPDTPPATPLDGFSLNGFDFPLMPELPQVGVTANWRAMTARYRGELQQAYQDYIEAAIGPDAVGDFRLAVAGGLRRK